MELQKKIVNKETNFMTQRVFHMIEFLSLNLQAPYVNFVLTFTSGVRSMQELTELHELSSIHQKFVLVFMVQHDVTKQRC